MFNFYNVLLWLLKKKWKDIFYLKFILAGKNIMFR